MELPLPLPLPPPPKGSKDSGQVPDTEAKGSFPEHLEEAGSLVSAL